MTAAALVAAVALLALGSAACAAGRTFRIGAAAQAVGAGLVGVVGFEALAANTAFGAGFSSGFTPHFGVDGLTAFFLATLGVVATPSFVFASRYLGSGARDRVIACLTGVFVLTLIEVLCARDALTFLAGWELMTLLPAALILVGRSDDAARRAVFLYLAITHTAGAGTWVAVLLSAHGGVLDGTHSVARGSGLQVAIALTALVGMGTKAGLMPLHSWLPRAHPIAPAPVSALMSGVMIKVAVYGLVRVLVDWLGVLPLWLGVLVLVLGALSAVGGVVYALFQHDLKRLLAFHSIENVGIIVLGLGACLLLRARGSETWAALALAAALLHTLNHAVFKSLLFLGAGAFERSVGSLELDRLGGLLRRMPWTGSAFLVGSLAIAGLPPLNGFASEWLTLQALVHVPAYGGLGDGLAGALALGALGATAALAVFCFVKVVGLVLLGQPRRATVAEARDAPLSMRAAVVGLAGACVALGVVPGLLVAPLARLAPWPVSVPTTLTLHVPGTGSLPTVAIALVLVLLVPVLVALRGRRVAAPTPTWVCGQLVQPQLAWTSAGFTKPLRLVLEPILRPEREIAVRSEGGVVQEVSYSGRVPQLIDERLYAPAVRSALDAARHARRLQSGRLGTYVGYLIALVLVLLAAAKAGLVG
jgi:hydrogenase-4 component B